MTFSKYFNLKNIRDIRFDEQGGLCYYCKIPMIKELPADRTSKGQPQNLCTIEHLIDRLNPARWEMNRYGSPQRYAAACARCNHARSAWNTLHTPKELILLLSHKPPNMSAKDLILGYYTTHEYVEPPPFNPSWSP